MIRKGKEGGSVVVEATIILPIFVFAMFFLLNFINLFIVHNRIQFAINSVAHEISAYSYVYSVTGLNEANKKLNEDGRGYTEKIDETVDNVMEFVGDAGKTIEKTTELSKNVGDLLDTDTLENPQNILEEKNAILDNGKELKESVEKSVTSGKQAASSVKERITDYKSTLKGLGFIALEGGIYKLKGVLAEGLVSFMAKKYLDTFEKSADEYLKVYGVQGGYKGLDFSGSSYLNDADNKMVDIVVSYDIKLIGAEFLKDISTVKVSQRVTIPAWLDGDGKKPREGLKVEK